MQFIISVFTIGPVELFWSELCKSKNFWGGFWKTSISSLRHFSAFHIWISDMGAYVIIIWKKRRQWYRLSPCHIDKLCIGPGGDRMRLQSSKTLFHPWKIMDVVARLNTVPFFNCSSNSLQISFSSWSGLKYQVEIQVHLKFCCLVL